ncbi:hypothetical protein Maq22A_c28265 [Methylobacterium aquaticum]|uniref:Uncharacterized protein n=1 Tax=Methylobacterium aquaticum TaxID=270351 RepID=A0A1Y0Z8P2_9HYPH|nr:hypothetical protein Maq22A_c28265 [Methylobacterium aquaticum]
MTLRMLGAPPAQPRAPRWAGIGAPRTRITLSASRPWTVWTVPIRSRVQRYGSWVRFAPAATAGAGRRTMRPEASYRRNAGAGASKSYRQVGTGEGADGSVAPREVPVGVPSLHGTPVAVVLRLLVPGVPPAAMRPGGAHPSHDGSLIYHDLLRFR